MAASSLTPNSQATATFSAVDQRALRAIAAQFFVNGALFASFIPRMPEIRDRVGISVAGVGLLMSVAGAFGILASVLVSPAIARFGTRRVLVVTAIALALSLPIVGLATAPMVLLVGLIGMFSLDVPVDVAMNMQGSWLSARRHTPVINRLHGLWSLGTVIGGVSSSWIAAAGVSLSVHLVGAAAILLGVIVYVGRGILRSDEEHDGPAALNESGGRRVRPALLLFLLAGLFAVALESIAVDWAAFRLADDFGASAGSAALAYVAVTVGMTIGRFGGDLATTRLGTPRLIRASTALSGIGLAMASLTSTRVIALVGYVIAGLGVATLMPVLYDTAAKHRGQAGAGLGALTAGLRVGALLIPTFVGTIAATDLTVGSAVALVALPSALGFAIIFEVLNRRSPAMRS